MGNNPQDEISLGSITEGTIDVNALGKYYVTEMK